MRYFATVVPRQSLPTITPLAPVLAKPYHRPGWVWEEKLDGWRILAYKDARHVRLVSRTGRDHAKAADDFRLPLHQWG